MLTSEEMALRFIIAMVLGALMGLERELMGKEAGVRTTMLVSGGSAVFTMISLALPEIVGISPDSLTSIPDRVISNIVVGIGFLGAGIIIKTTHHHVHGLTTAAMVWVAAGTGILAGLDMIPFAIVVALVPPFLLYFLRICNIDKHIRPDFERKNHNLDLDTN